MDTDPGVAGKVVHRVDVGERTALAVALLCRRFRRFTTPEGPEEGLSFGIDDESTEGFGHA